MPIEVIPYQPEHEPHVQALNGRLEAGGSDWKFYNHAVPKWAPAGLSAHVGREYFVAIDDTRAARGGFCLKNQTFGVRGQPIEAASIQGPVSEGLVDPRYAMLAMRLVRDMERRQTRLFAWGASERIAELLSRLGWTRSSASMAMRVFRGGRVVRGLPQLQAKTRLRPALALLAATGLADLGAALAHAALSIRAGGAGRRKLTVSETDSFGGWADEIWQASAAGYDLIARRDAETMNIMLPAGRWPNAQILRFEDAGRTVGWAAVKDTRFEGDSRFGDLRVGSIVDSLALPGQEAAVIAAATDYLRRRGVDLAVSIYSHRTWLNGFRAAGYIVQADRRPVYMSPAFAELALAGSGDLGGAHLTPMDGDGPHGF